MRRFLPVALIVTVAVASPVFAQRGSARGGSSGRSAPSFHGAFSGSAHAYHGSSPGAFASGPRYGVTAPPRYNFGPPRFGTPSTNRFSPHSRVPSVFFARSDFAAAGQQRATYRPPYTGDNRSRRNHRSGGVPWAVWPYNYPFIAYPGFYEYPPWGDFDDSSDESQTYAPQDYASQAPDQQPPEYPALPPWPALIAPPYPPQLNAGSESAAPQSEEAVTLVFNNGRPPEMIHNYLLTASTLYVMDPRRREIPVDELDLAATAKANREAGVDFKLPVASN